MEQVHGTSVVIGVRGVLLLGPSGSGKSDLAMRLIDRGAELVADDYVDLELSKAGIQMSAPEQIAGMLELRGVGLISLSHAATAKLELVIELVPAAEVPRLPDAEFYILCGRPVPKLRLYPFELSAPIKVEQALVVASKGLEAAQ
ncbi:MAG: serine/threonine protein kinase [Rhodospirillales bacterium]|nr:serine/threonine protein kinase [Rhodospirillales bacterium]